jgi:AcrR family transcriptional regulator
MTELASRRPGRPRDESIDAAILDACIDELIERGYNGLSVEAIAARAGVAKTTLYRRWPNVDDLVLESLQAFEPKTDGEEPQLAAGREELLYLADRMRRTWNNPRYASLMRRVAADGNATPGVYLHFRNQLLRPRVERMNRALRRAVDAGIIRPDTDLDWVRMMIVAPILASAMTHKDRVSPTHLALTIDTVLTGVAP